MAEGRVFTYAHSRPAVTVDTVLFAPRAGDLAVLLVRRKKAPFKGHWALPGGFVEANEPLAAAAARELEEETGISGVPAEQLGAFGDPGRDPRGHTISVVHYAFVLTEPRPTAGDDAAEAAWHPLRTLPIKQPLGARRRARLEVELAFDHAKIIEAARARLQEKLHAPTLPSRLRFVPQHFTLTELQRVYESVFGYAFEERDFRARMLANSVVALDAPRRGVRASAQLYRWNAP